MRDSIELLVGEVTKMTVDAIVSPANNESLLATDMASTIAVRAGAELTRECNQIGGIQLGEAVITGAGKLPCKHVIHAACMDYDGTSSEEILILATRNALQRAKEADLKSMALPPLDPSGQSFPLKRCAELMISEVIRHTEKEATLETILFVLSDQGTLRIFEECLKQV